MPYVTCCVGGCHRRLRPLLKPDRRDPETWIYRECDLCFKPTCERHCSERCGRIICNACGESICRPPLHPLLRLLSTPEPARKWN